jgi:glycerophosphoryl diester phosphodiesterase
MRKYIILPILILFAFFPWQCSAKLVIADGGASGYLMKNNLAATALAVNMNADIINLDLVLNRDNEVVVFSSPYLEDASDVAEIFPERIREDGHYYVLDFTMEELRQLTLQNPETRIPASRNPHFTITGLGEQLSLIQSLEKSLGHSIRIAVSLVKPWIHRRENRDLTGPVLSTLLQYGYTGQNDKILLLSYDVEELQRISKELLPALQMQIKLVQVIDQPDGREYMVKEWGEYRSYSYDLLFSNSGLRALAGSVAAIALPKYMLADEQGKLKHVNFINNAQKLGTMIFTFPVQKESQTRLAFSKSFTEELEFLYFTVGVDGIFTDYCDDVSRFLKNRVQTPAVAADEESLLPERVPATKADDPLNLTSPSTPEN